jgi:uncharacterized protein (DUF1015 family)
MPTMDADLPFGPSPEEFSSRIFGATEPADPAAPGPGLELAPFRGVRFAPEVVGDLTAVTTPPYDLIHADEVARLRAADGHNIVRLILPDDYGQARTTLRRWLAEGALVADESPALYVYEVADGDVPLQRGLVGAVGLRAESAGVVLPHENVYPGPVRDRLALMTATAANLEPIFLIYQGGGEAARIVDSVPATAAPMLAFEAGDGTTHRLWRVADPALHARIGEDLRARQALIADGHHRYATYRALQARHHAAGDGPGPWDYGLALLVDSTRYPPHLGAIHRVLPGLAPELAVERAKAGFRVTPVASVEALADAARPAFLLGGGDGLFLLTDPDPAALESAMPAAHSALWRQLDTAVLDRLLIERLWGVAEDEHTVEIVHELPAAALARARRAGGTAVILNPLDTGTVLEIAAGGERVPRKSTSFGPKPRTGLVLRLLDLG